MHSIQYLQEKFKNALDAQEFSYDPPELYQPIGYTLALGGKRLRPVLMLMGCDLFEGDIEKAIPAAIGLEIFHNFTLLHDDIMDKAPIRRGKPSVYKKWNTNIAILSGDTMFAIAYNYVAETEKELLPDVLKVFTQTAKEVCEGQQYDLNYEVQAHVSLNDYTKMIRLKTAVLFAASLKIGAIIAGADANDIQNLYLFGENTGMAFQLRDDLLDVYGIEEKFGKKTGGDILANKKTFLYLKAFELAEGSTRDKLNSCFIINKYNRETKIKEVIEIYNQLGVKASAENEMDKYYQKAMEHLDKVKVEKKRKQELIRLAKTIAIRDY
ncbi:MAG: polyprenyl synthetase family protein [Bacteroidales bacterium]|nr:polyprenyl synthetase family protein [Bacteroidales bacterium]